MVFLYISSGKGFQDSRGPGFTFGYARQARVRVKITEKQIHIEKFLTLGTAFYIDIL